MKYAGSESLMKYAGSTSALVTRRIPRAAETPKQYGKRRRCDAYGCNTVLSRYNPNDECAVHHPVGATSYITRDRGTRQGKGYMMGDKTSPNSVDQAETTDSESASGPPCL